MFDNTKEIINCMKQDKPLVLNITNYVTMDFIANGLLSLGVSPVMSKAEQEIEDLLKLSKSVVINLGTLNDEFIRLCKHTCQVANKLNVPIVLDPVGAGASRYRTEACISLIDEYNMAIIRGNASEIMALSGLTQKTKGVDSLGESEQAIESAQTVSKQYDAAVIVSGKTDFVIDGKLLERFDRGSPLMPTITGTGCLLSAVVGAFHTTEKNRFAAAKMATLFYGICGEIAEKKATGPGSFRTHFLDTLHCPPDRGLYEKK